MDVGTRLLRYFATVAAEGNLTRAAERLFIRSRAGVAWAPANDADPVVQDFVRCCLDNKPAHPHEPA